MKRYVTRGIALKPETDAYLRHLKNTKGLNISAYLRIALEAKLKADGLAQTETRDE